MSDFVFSDGDLEQIGRQGLTPEAVRVQIRTLRTGCPFLTLARPARLGDGIREVAAARAGELIRFYDESCRKGRFSKFVPASGAASRMFKSLLAVYESLASSPQSLPLDALRHSENPDEQVVYQFLSRLKEFAFYPELEAVMADQGIFLPKLDLSSEYVKILRHLLTAEGLDYGELPKGMIPFHKEGGECLTAFQEHVSEAAGYLADERGRVNVHFTVPSSHEDAVSWHLKKTAEAFALRGLSVRIRMSSQDPSTEAVAVDENGVPVRDEKGRLVFYPTGHGALLGNLRDCGGDLVFLKNIDNVAPKKLREAVYRAQKILGGFLVMVQAKVFGLLERLEAGTLDEKFLSDVRRIAGEEFGLWFRPDFDCQPAERRREELHRLLDRPIRVCGMVLNRGEPGGGPFWVRGKGGVEWLQIVEKSQVDTADESQRKILGEATHFNPVNLAVGLRDRTGQPYDLTRFSDPETCFVSQKSTKGKPVRVLELPGLWNGGMAGWLTFFIEIPEDTFHPVKTVLDLLKPGHQP